MHARCRSYVACVQLANTLQGVVDFVCMQCADPLPNNIYGDVSKLQSSSGVANMRVTLIYLGKLGFVVSWMQATLA
eukprot:4089710-Pyramimonas_sp.AAC.1